MASLFRDLRLAARTLARKRGLTLLAIASLAIAIGFSSAAFSVLDAFGFRELPVRDPRSLAWIYATTREQRIDNLSWIEYQAIVARSHFFTGVLAQDRRGPRVRLPDRDDFPITSGVSDNFFDLLGVRAQRGDVFHSGDQTDNGVVLTDHYWQTALAGDPNIIGRVLPVGDAMLRVMGVLPPGFAGPARGILSDLFVPPRTMFGALGLNRPTSRTGHFELIGRLRPGAARDQARAELTAILHQVDLEGRSPGPDRKANLEDFTEGSLAAKLSSNALLLAVAVLLVLIAAANLANLRLADNEGRRAETAVRLALGAGRAALARQHLVETALLGASGLAAGIGLAAWLIRLAPALFYGGRDYVDFNIRLDLRTFAFSCAALLLAVAIGGLVPLADAWKRSLLPALGGIRTTRASRWLGALVVAQMALATAGACSAGLLIRSLNRLSEIRPAMDPRRALLLVHGFWDSSTNMNLRAETLGSRIAAAPGVDSVAWARRALLSGSGGGAAVEVEVPAQPKFSFYLNQVSPSYFAVTGARILSGRGFLPSDGPASTPVVMVNAAFVRRFFPGRSPIGQWIKCTVPFEPAGSPINGRDHQIVGVVEDGPTIHLREPVAPYLYFAFAQHPPEDLTFFVAARRDTASLAETLRPYLRRIDPSFTTLNIVSLRAHMRNARSDEEVAATITASLSAAALLLAAAGLLGVTLYAIARRTREFGIRVAMGARPRDLARAVFRQTAVRIAIALPLGWAMAYAARHALESKLYGIAPDDPTALIVSSAVVAGVAILAALQPALRAARVDPVVALRQE